MYLPFSRSLWALGQLYPFYSFSICMFHMKTTRWQSLINVLQSRLPFSQWSGTWVYIFKEESDSHDPVHTRPDKHEKGVFNLKTQHLLFVQTG